MHVRNVFIKKKKNFNGHVKSKRLVDKIGKSSFICLIENLSYCRDYNWNITLIWNHMHS